MTANAEDLARQTFRAAVRDGPAEQPTSLQQLLAQMAGTSGQPASLDTEALEHALDAEFPFLRPLVSAGKAPDGPASARWEAAVRWVLDALSNWDGNTANALDQVRALLIAARALDARSAGLKSVVAELASENLTTVLLRLVESVDVAPVGFLKSRFPELRQELKLATNEGNYEHLDNLLPHLMPEPHSDLWAAIVLLWKLEPAKFATAVENKDEVLFSMLVCDVLEESALEFAVQVPLIAFKFVSISNLQHAHNTGRTPHDWGDLLRQLLLQVAQTSHWAGWMRALFRYPDSESLTTAALAKALVDLEERHWSEFIEAVSLGYSRRAAAHVAKIMELFAAEAGADKATQMWSIAFQRYDQWNYAKGQKQAHLFAPSASALDYPVSMYYSKLPAAELDAQEAGLTQAVDEVEQQWFDSGSDLITERNRLLSRLRLVRHGRAVAAGSTELLPASIEPEENVYARVRYHYHDVHVG